MAETGSFSNRATQICNLFFFKIFWYGLQKIFWLFLQYTPCFWWISSRAKLSFSTSIGKPDFEPSLPYFLSCSEVRVFVNIRRVIDVGELSDPV